jgi:alpha-L-fucosidase
MKPKKEQLEFLKWELGLFIHFGIRTFYEGHTDFDKKPMPPEAFNPSGLDCEQWIRNVYEAGVRYAVLVCKHHDGFALWPSAYTDYSVANTPWKGGKGDVVREYVNACRKYGVKVGFYYSPAECSFGQPARHKDKDYDDYFINQIGELLTNYGKIDYLWFDGCGSEDHEYDTGRIVAAIRALQSEILIFNMWDPDTRWGGNESGYAQYPNDLVVTKVPFSILTDKDDQLDKDRFLPLECNFRMRRLNWFYSDTDEDTVKSLDELKGIYYYSVGRGANFLVNIGPDRRGLLPEKDCERLRELGAWIKNSFASPISSSFTVENGKYINKFTAPALVNTVVLRESEATLDTVKKFIIRACPHPYGDPIKVYEGDTVGVRHICAFPPFYATKLEVEITSAAGEHAITEMSVHFVK